jgi:hypothetical protein
MASLEDKLDEYLAHLQDERALFERLVSEQYAVQPRELQRLFRQFVFSTAFWIGVEEVERDNPPEVETVRNRFLQLLQHRSGEVLAIVHDSLNIDGRSEWEMIEAVEQGAARELEGA